MSITLLFTAHLLAANRYWDRNGNTMGSGNTGGVWDTTTANWNGNMNGNGSPNTIAATDVAIFSAGTDGTGNITVTGNATAAGLIIDEGTINFTGTITLNASAISVSSVATLVTNNASGVSLSTTAGSVVTLNGGTLRSTLASAGSFFDGDSTITLNGGGIIDYTVANTLSTIQSTTVISGSGGLTKNGVGVIGLASASTYSGGTTVNGGELRIAGAGNRLPTTGNVTVNASGILNLNDNDQTIGTLSGSGRVGLGSGTLTASSSSSSTFSGTIEDTANAGASGSTNTGGKLTKSGTGTLTLSGTSANTYTGLTTVTNGQLDLSKTAGVNAVGDGVTINGASAVVRLVNDNQIIDTSAMTITAGTFNMNSKNETIASLTGAGAVTNMGTLTLAGTASTTYSGNASGTGSLVKASTSTGTTTLSGSNSYSGGTTLNGGTLALGSSGAIGTTGTISFGGGTLQFSGSNTTDYSARFSNAASQAYSLDTNGQNVTLATALASSGGTLTKLGAGTLTLTGTNTYTGLTTISAGTLSVGNGGTAGSIADGIANNAALIFNRSNALTHSGAISGTGTLTKQGAGALTLSNATGNTYGGGTTVSAGQLIVTNTSGSGTGTGNVTVNGGSLEVGNGGTGGSVSGNIVNNATVNFNRSDASSYAGQISGTGAVTKNGAGTHTLTGINSYGGGTTVSAGTLQGHTDSLQGAILNNAAVIFDQGFNGTYAGTMSGSGSLTKNGFSVVTLTAANSYAGGTTINAGTLLVNNTSGSGTGSGPVNVVGGTLGGTGSVSGSVTVQNGAVLSPGASIETLASGSLVFNTGSTLNYELQTNAPLALGADLIDSTGGLNIAAGVTLAMFDLAAGFQLSGTKYTVIAYNGAWNGGTFVGLGDDTQFFSLGKQWKVNYNDTTPGANFASEALDNASFVTLTVVPEASSVIAMGLTGFCAAAAVYMRKRFGLKLFEI
jgi:autotransporter-associated beta strand protein